MHTSYELHVHFCMHVHYIFLNKNVMYMHTEIPLMQPRSAGLLRLAQINEASVYK